MTSDSETQQAITRRAAALPGTRRAVLKAGAALLLAGAGLLPARPVQAAAGRSHGLSFFGDLKYPADFPHFDYVVPDAPKGGTIVLQTSSWLYNQNPVTFNTLNNYVLQGDGALGMGMTFTTLMAGSLDEPDSLYPALAREVEVSGDARTYRFFLRPEATFHDGSPITAADVVFSVETLRRDGHPNIAMELGLVAEIAAEDPHTVRAVLAATASKSVALTLAAGVPIFSAAWWQGRDFKGALSTPPLGSGAYKVRDFSFGRSISFDRVADWWGADLPAFRGAYNFDVVRYDYYRDRVASFEAFKKGDLTFREEFTSRIWARDYEFPALNEGKVKRDEVPDGTPAGGQGWYFNMRRPKFADPRVREALAMVFDFEWANKTIMFDSYQRSHSFFENSPLKAVGTPGPEEIAILERFRGRIPDAAFGEAFVPAASDGTGRDRRPVLQAANDLLVAAGCRRDGRRLLLPSGEPFTIEFLDDDNAFEAHHNAFIRGLELLGVAATYRVVDAAQYNARKRDFDYDMLVGRFSTPLYPDGFIRQFFGSASAAQPGSYNLAGVADPAVDELLTLIVEATTRDDFTHATRALDRVLRAMHVWVPQWYKPTNWFAWWDVYGRPPVKPPYGRAVLETWWLDRPKAEALGRGL